MSPSTGLAILIFGTMVLTVFAFFMILFVLLQKRKQYQFKIEKQELEHAFNSELLQSRIEVQEQSLKYLSEEIHDNIGPMLSLAKMNIFKMAKQASENEIVQKSADQSTELLTKAIADLRSISHTANGGMILNAELEESIEKELNYVSSARNINCNFSKEGLAYSLGQERNLLVFRIIQESIANALKHANPENIEINIRYETDRFIVLIKDDGTGFDVEKINASGGLGLNNMRTRAAVLKGDIYFDSAKEKGTIITLNIPHPQ